MIETPFSQVKLKNDMRNLIICPVGNLLTFDLRFDEKNHWRYTKSNRNYETFVFAYSDFVPESGTYDRLIHRKGFKWSLAKEAFNNGELRYEDYDFIGFMDDDLITDIDNLNRALEIANEKDFKIFQLSLTQDSDAFFGILKNKPGIKYSKTNFVETMGMFVHSSLMPTIIDYWNKYDIYCGWGLDKVLCDITKTDAAVIHSSQMYHPPKLSSYDKMSAFEEMHIATNIIAPQFIKDKYNEEWMFRDTQFEKEIVMETT